MTNCRPKSSFQRQSCHSQWPLLTYKDVLLNSPLFWQGGATAARCSHFSRLKEMSSNLLSLAGLIFSPRPQVSINEVDKQLFRENNSLLIRSHSSTPLSIQLISIMKWQVRLFLVFLTPSLTDVHTQSCKCARTQTC